MLKWFAITLIFLVAPTQARAAALTDAEAIFLDQLVTAGTVLEQRCTGYEVDGASAVQAGARLLSMVDAAMAMISAYDAAIKAHDNNPYDPTKFRPEVADATSRTSNRVRAALIRNPTIACASYGDSSVDRGLLRRY